MRLRIGNIELAGTYRESVSAYRYTSGRQLQISPVFRAAPKIFDRGRGLSRMSFTVSRLHVSVVEAVRFMLDHPKEITNEGVTEISLEYDNAQIVRWFVDAKVEVVDQSFMGQTTTHSYQIVGTEVSSEAPQTS